MQIIFGTQSSSDLSVDGKYYIGHVSVNSSSTSINNIKQVIISHLCVSLIYWTNSYCKYHIKIYTFDFHLQGFAEVVKSGILLQSLLSLNIQMNVC